MTLPIYSMILTKKYLLFLYIKLSYFLSLFSLINLLFLMSFYYEFDHDTSPEGLQNQIRRAT